MRKQYRVPGASAIVILAGFVMLVSACQGLPFNQEPTETPRPWASFRGQDIVDGLTAAGLTLQNVDLELAAGRGAPLTFTERLIFEIPRIAPNGGQIVIFRSAEDMQTWIDWIEDLRHDPETRRDVVYVYTNQNAIIQLNASLTNQEAAAYRDTFLALQ